MHLLTHTCHVGCVELIFFFRSPTGEISGPCLGGVLADVMGLGKTLTTISLIVHMKGEAANFRSCQRELPSNNSAFVSKATLVVVPSLRLLPQILRLPVIVFSNPNMRLAVLEVWATEIKE
jgi:hypothetical protein